jgi:hypothetical protein
MKDYNPANVFIICVAAVLITAFVMIGVKENRRINTTLTAQINEIYVLRRHGLSGLL